MNKSYFRLEFEINENLLTKKKEEKTEKEDAIEDFLIKKNIQ